MAVQLFISGEQTIWTVPVEFTSNSIRDNNTIILLATPPLPVIIIKYTYLNQLCKHRKNTENS